MIDVGQIAPAFCLSNQEGVDVSLEDFSGTWLILYFYPKDNTSGCTREALDFTASRKDFEKLNAAVLGISPDSVKSHEKFAERNELDIPLLSDPEHQSLESYGSWGKKKMYGKEFMGVIRSTVVIDPRGKIAATWDKVKVDGHVEEVMQTLIKLQAELD